MRKTENVSVAFYYLTENEYRNPLLLNQCIIESDRQYMVFVKEEICSWGEKFFERMVSESAIAGVLYLGEQDGKFSYDQIFLADAEHILGIFFDRSIVQKCGSFHPHAESECIWEYLCRLTKETGGCHVLTVPADEVSASKESSAECLDEKAFVHAYVVRSHISDLHRRGLMDSVFQRVCIKMQKTGCYEKFMQYMNLFLADSAQYERIVAQTASFLVLRGDDTCMGVLQKFADDLAEALVREGQAVQLIGNNPEQYDELPGHVYKGIIGFQTKALEIDFFRNLTGPKFQFWFDYPLRFQNILRNLPEEYYVLCQDADYADQIRKFYHTPNAIQFPPGGIAQEWEERERPYDIVFVGSFLPDEGNDLEGIQKEYYEFMLKHPECTFEKGYQKMTGCCGTETDPENFAELMLTLKPASRAVIGHFRNKVIKKILECGYSLHVYGDGWHDFRYTGSNLVIHPQVTVEKSLQELQKAKIGLNIMSWHKAGMTERVANIMLSGAVCLSDESVFLKEHMQNGEEIILFALSELDRLPDLIGHILHDDEKRNEMAHRAYEKAMREFTWEVRAKELVELAEKRNIGKF